MEDGQQCAIATDITGPLMMQLLYGISWDIQVQVFPVLVVVWYIILCIFKIDTHTGAEAPCCARLGPGPSRQPVQQDHFWCRGSENSLVECNQDIGSNCEHSQDLSVICIKCNSKLFL